MRLRLGSLIAAVFATLLSPITPQALAAGGYASAPNSVSSTAIAGGLRVSWTTPTDVDSGITGYRVEYSTSGTSGTWNLSTTVSASTFTSDILGLSAVETYIRVAATTAAGTGQYGYPWTKIYGTTNPKNNSGDASITYESTFGLGAGTASNTYSASNFTRVKYRLDSTINGTADYAETDFYTWATSPSTVATSRTVAPTISNLQVPVPVNSSSGFVIQANVTDLNVYSTNSRVTNAGGLSGRLEIWPWNYDFPASGLSPVGSATKYDYDDTPSTGNTAAVAGSYGAFQVHDLTNSKTVFAWNFHAYSGVTDPDLGYGNNPNATGHPDWTFCHDNNATNGYCQSISAFRLQIYVNIPVTPLADATPPTVTRIDSRSIGKNGDTVTVQSNEIGTAYLVNQTVNVTNLASITAAATSNKISVSISAVNTSTTMTIGAQSDGLYNLYAADAAGNLSTAITGTIKIDNTIPTFTALAVSSAGTALTLTASETITNSMQVYGFYQLNDSGTAISVTGTSYSGNIATLTLSRAIPAGASIVLTYAPSSGAAGGRWIDQARNEVAAFTNRVVTNNSTTPISITFNVPATIYKGSSVTISLVVPVTGKVTFSLAGKRLPGCFNRAATGSLPITISCNWKPALSTAQSLTATFAPTNTSIATATTTVNRFILRRTTTR